MSNGASGAAERHVDERAAATHSLCGLRLRGWIAVALLLTALWLVLGWLDDTQGLAYMVDFRHSVRRGVTHRLDPASLLREPHVLRERALFRYSGLWRVSESGVHVISLLAKGGGAALILDGVPVLERTSDTTTRRTWKMIHLEKGLHRIALEYAGEARPLKLMLLAARPGEPPRPVPERRFFVSEPSRYVALFAWGRVASGYSAALAWLFMLALGLRRIGPHAWRLLPVVVVLFGAILRFEALVGRYWLDDAPAWAHRLEAFATHLRPHSVQWAPDPFPYDGDAAGYLHHARRMQHFYAGSGREPVFVFVTHAFLPVAKPENMAVNFASCLFSAIAVGATYLLGAAAFGPAAGLIASAALAIERQAVGLAADGWRDDSFACMIALSAWALLRLRARPDARRALIAGVTGALATLTRITAVSYLAPALLLIALCGPRAERSARIRSAALAFGVLLLLVTPYLVSCWQTFGDPLIAVNTHASFYRDREGLPGVGPSSWTEYVLGGRRALDRIETLVAGLTTYPFENKWQGFDDWSPFLGGALRLAALCGLALAAASPSGRLLLLILATSLVPFGFTWRVIGGSEWRFTLFAYPFFLSAVGLAVTSTGRLLAGLRRRVLFLALQRRRRHVLVASIAGAFLASLPTLLLPSLAYLRAADAARAGKPIDIDAEMGARGRFFFASGWGETRVVHGEVVRISTARSAKLRVPLAGGREYRLVLSVGFPFHADAATVEIWSGELLLDRLRLDGAARLSTHEIHVPQSAARGLATTIELRVVGERDALSFQRLRIEPLHSPDSFPETG